MTPQNYYKKRKHRQLRKVDHDLVIELVKRERKIQTRVGGKKLHRMFQPELKAAGVKTGRDCMFDVMRDNDLLLKPLKSAPKTTNSRHSLPVFSNLIKDKEVTAPNQVWVCDITYIKTGQGFVYLALIMDLYSRKIVGYNCGDSLESANCQKALEQAIAQLPEGCSPIHHSDRGCQYCCHEYVDLLNEHNIAISMTEDNHCAENSHAERLNGILKQEQGLGGTLRCDQHCAAA